MTMKTREFFIYHFPLITYAALVVLFSSIPHLAGPKIRLLAFDKLAHFCEYAVFAFLTYRSFARMIPSQRKLLFLLCSLFLISFAALDEYFQSFIPGRHSDPLDLATDLGGASLVLILLAILSKRAKSKL